MYLQALANRVPPQSFVQEELWNAYRKSESQWSLKTISKGIIEKVLLGDNGVEKRHFALADLEAVPKMDAETLNRQYEIEAPRLAKTAFEESLEKAHLKADEIDALIICTCTGYICPGITSHVAEQTGMRRDALLLDLVGLGCGASIPAIRNAASIIGANPQAKVAVIAVEICSAAFYLDDDPGVIISACLFGDGASASIWSGSSNGGYPLRAEDFDTWHEPEKREILRFENSGGKLRNRLHITVPPQAAQAVEKLLRRSQERNERPISQVISHTGGRNVLLALERAIPEYKLDPSKEVLRKYGNMSSPSVMFALEEFLSENEPPENGDIWLTAFGAGFAAHSFRLVQD